MVPFADELVADSGLPHEALIEIGTFHRFSEPESMQAILNACERLVTTKKDMENLNERLPDD